jgi:ProP effector
MTKRITKTDLNKLAKSLYGEDAYCEHTRSGKRGWYLYKDKDTEQTFIGANANEAFGDLESQAPQSSETPATPATAPVVNEAFGDLESQTPQSSETPVPPTTPVEKSTNIPITQDVATETPTASKKKTNIPIKPDSTTDSFRGKLEITNERTEHPISPEELLEILLEKFPNTFFREPEKIRPIQKYIHKKIRRVFDGKYTKNEILAALALYTQTIDYCKKIIEGGERIDLEGKSCGEIPQQHIEDALARVSGKKSMRPAKEKKAKPPKVPLSPPDPDQLISGKMEILVKIHELPADSKTLRNGWEEFVIDAKGLKVKIAVRPRTWKKLQQANKEYSLWVANIRGKMGPQRMGGFKGGFELLTPGIQIFERMPKKL